MDGKQIEDLIVGILKTEIDKEISNRVRAVLGDLESNGLIRQHGINHKFIDFTGVKLSGDNISSGLIKDFNSTGIQDKATNCQLTVSDDFTIVENTLLTNAARINGSLQIDGDLTLKGNLNIHKSSTASIEDLIKTKIEEHLSKLDIVPTITHYIIKLFKDPKKNNLLHEQSLSHKYINFSGARFTGDFIRGGTIRDFNSTGIQDLSKNCQLTITDDTTIIENKLVASDIEVKDKLTVVNELDLKENAEKTLSNVIIKRIFDDKTDYIIDILAAELQTRKLDIKNLVVDGEPLLEDHALASTITNSKLEKVGLLRDLKVVGDSIFADTISIVKGKLGINTIKPVAPLTVWDQETEVVVRKAYKNTAYIGTDRNNNLVLGAHNKNNIVLGADGTVNVDDLTIASMKISVSSTEPGHKGNTGDIVFNTNPIAIPTTGWQCLGGTRWKRF